MVMDTKQIRESVDSDSRVYENDLPMAQTVDAISSAHDQIMPFLKDIEKNGVTFKSLQPYFLDGLLCFASNVSNFLKYFYERNEQDKVFLDSERFIHALPRLLMLRTVQNMVDDVCFPVILQPNDSEDYYQIPHFQESLGKLKNFVRKSYNDKECTGFDVVDIVELATMANYAMHRFTDTMSHFFDSMLHDIHDSISKMSFNLIFNIECEIDKRVARYSKVHYQDCLQLLKLEAQKHKSNPAHQCTPEIWGKVCLEERETYRMILDNTYVNHIGSSPIYDLKPSTTALQRNHKLISALVDISVDGVLWYYNPNEEIEELHNDDGEIIRWHRYPCLVSTAYSLIDSDNFLVYCYFALRHNIIQCQIHPELRPIFNQWAEKLRFEDEMPTDNNEDTTQHTHQPQPTDNKTTDDKELAKWLSDNNKIINLKVSFNGKDIERDIVQLYHFIKEHGVQGIEKKYEWYAIYKFLVKKGYLSNPDISKFVEQMNLWYPDATIKCNQNETRLYNFLGNHDVEEWPYLDKSKLSKKKSLNGAKRIHALYTNLIKKHDAL